MSFERIKLKSGHQVLIDAEDLPKFSQHTWHVHPYGGYVETNIKHESGKTSKLTLHRLLVGSPGFFVDHKNHNKLDNRRSNLRACTQSQNNRNALKRPGNTSSRFKGCYFNKVSKKWQASISVNLKRLYQGSFDSEIDAAIAYDCAAKKLHGDFACLNFK